MAGYESEEQARAAAAGLIERSRPARRRPAPPQQIRADYLREALTAAGVELGAFDEEIVGWLGRSEPGTVQAVVRWIESAAAGAESPAEEETEAEAYETTLAWLRAGGVDQAGQAGTE